MAVAGRVSMTSTTAVFHGLRRYEFVGSIFVAFGCCFCFLFVALKVMAAAAADE